MKRSMIAEMQMLMDWCNTFIPVFVLCSSYKDVIKFRRTFMKSADGLYCRARINPDRNIVDTSRYLNFDRHGILDLFEESTAMCRNTLSVMNAARSQFEDKYKRCLFILVKDEFRYSLVDFPDLYSISKIFVVQRQQRIVGKQRARKLRKRGENVMRVGANIYSWQSNIYI